MGYKALLYSHSRDNAKGGRECRMCGNRKALIRKYGLYVCRQCFRENANDLGFAKVCEFD